jgi:hypothetical protein
MAKVSPHIDAVTLGRQVVVGTAGNIADSGVQAVRNSHDRLVFL